MARGRVGGSRSKISGRVGSEIFSIVKNESGGYRQVVSESPDSRSLALTPELAKQRMFMSIVMRHMNLLQVFMNAAFEDVPEGTLSVQEFARVNVRWLQEHYTQDWPFRYKVWWPTYGTSIALPAPIIISQGTFRVNTVYNHFMTTTQLGGVVEIQFVDMYAGQSFNGWLNENKMGLREYLCDMHFTMGEDGNSPSYEYVRFNVNINQNLDKKCFEIDPNDFFITVGPIVGSFSWLTYDGDGHRKLKFTSKRILKLRYLNGFATLQFGMQDGKWRQSNSQVNVPSANTIASHNWISYEDAFKTWYDDRVPVPPTPTHRIPLEYQEVQYITALGDVRMRYDITINMTKMSIEFKVSVDSENTAFIIFSSNHNGNFNFRVVNSNNRWRFGFRSRSNNQNTYSVLTDTLILNKTYHFIISTDDEGYVVVEDGVTQRLPNAGAIYDYDIPYIQLFGSSEETLKGSLYEIIIRDKNTDNILHDLVPCYRKSDGAIGFYDISDSYFLTVVDSQTLMTYGPIVNPT